MKLQFSLATLLIVIAVVALDLVICREINVYEQPTVRWAISLLDEVHDNGFWRKPTDVEVARRVVCSGPLAIAGTFGLLWAIHRLKSRRHTEPPVGQNSTSVARHAAATVN